jgi:integrase
VKYPKALANCLRHTDAFFGDLPPPMIERLTVRAYVASRRRSGVKDATIDKELRIFRQTLKFGVREKWMADEPYVPTPGGSASRQRFLTRAEFAAIYFASSPLHLRTFLALAIDTLARGKAILGLRWDRVDFDAGVVWYKPHDPGSRKRTVAAPMSERLANVLRAAQEAAEGPYVVEWRGKRVLSVRKAYERAVRLSGVKNAHRHDLRRSGASWAVQDGMSFDAVAALLGDSVEVTQQTYAVFSPTYLKGVVDSIATGTGGRTHNAHMPKNSRAT